MDAYARISRLPTVVGIALGVALANTLRSWIDGIAHGAGTSLLIQAGVVVLISELSRHLSEHYLYGIRVLREQILRDQYVEGTWVECVTDHSTSTRRFGIITISPVPSGVLLTGENFDSVGDSVSTFCSDIVSITWPKLAYTYTEFESRRSTHEIGNQDQAGRGDLLFDLIRSAPQRFTGHFEETTHGRRYEMQAWRVNRKNNLLADLNSPQLRRDAVCALIASHFPEPDPRPGDASESPPGVLS